MRHTTLATLFSVLFTLGTVVFSAVAAGEATVQDLINCLGALTRFSIRQVGPGIHITSSPFEFKDAKDGDDVVRDCLVKLEMQGVTHKAVHISELFPTIPTSAGFGIDVRLDFVPRTLEHLP